MLADKLMKINKKICFGVGALIGAIFFAVQAEAKTVTVAQAFYEVARQKNAQKIEMLLNRGYSIESVNEKGYNPVCLAVAKQDKAAYNILVKYGAKTKPSCLQKISDKEYERFFGTRTSKFKINSDKPYLLGAAALGAGAVAAAYIFRGSTDGGHSERRDTPPDKKTCPNGTYDEETDTCICWNGYEHYGDESACYKSIVNCANQVKDKCKKCDTNYYIEDNKCYAHIAHCKIQKGSLCDICDSGYGTHKGDKKYCYSNIAHCKDQETSNCNECEQGYGTYGGNSVCYETIKHCINQQQSACLQCEPGYDTYGDPHNCYEENPCAAYSHTVPYKENNRVMCRCDENKGYTGEPENCQQAEDGNYQEGEGNKEEWNNLNARYCHSHGKYNINTGLCTCYKGYSSEENGCAECAEGYIDSNGLCYYDLHCSSAAGLVQENDQCVCASGYIEFDGVCTPKIKCPEHHEQKRPGTSVEEVCECKANFDENCENCLSGFSYDAETDSCVRTHFDCEEKWTGIECNICPNQYKITIDEQGVAHCGFECAENRAPYDAETNPDCLACAENYEKSEWTGNCITTECTTGVEGYIKDDQGHCTCDTANGYAMSLLGVCKKKEPDLIGISNRNINNQIVEVANDGDKDGFRDVYGMKAKDDSDNYYDEVYNALSSGGTKEGKLNITNTNAGGNMVYGIYSPNDIYNAAAINNGSGESAAIGEIKIIDSNTLSEIYGIKSDGEGNIFNSLAQGSGQNTADNKGESNADGKIDMKKENTSDGNMIGITGNGNIYNAYASTKDGVAADANANGLIIINHKGHGQVIGIEGISAVHKLNNAYAYLDSPASGAVAKGEIKVSGNNDVYGIWTNGTIANSETQFDKKYNKFNDFTAEGAIEATAKSMGGTAYGMYIGNTGNLEVNVYNAMGYKSTGNITATHETGGSAYGIKNMTKLFEEEQNGRTKSFYNNTYNAFRSSAKYGGEDTAAAGTVTVNIKGGSNALADGVGIYAAGNIFNAYAKSGSDVMLESKGNITVNDESSTSGISLRGIESGGATIANAYATGENKNSTTQAIGNININVSGNKQGGTGKAAGIYSDEPSAMVAQIYNAALINDKSKVEGNINVISNGRSALHRMYGIYASRYQLNGGNPEDGQEKAVYNAYYENEDNVSDGSVLGTINVSTTIPSAVSNAEYYGIYVNEGTAYNAYSTAANADVIGKIKVDTIGGERSGISVGMYGNKASLYNSGANSVIEVKTKRVGNDAYGMKGDNSYIENDALIDVTSESNNAYGLYVDKGQAINNKNGVINVSGKKAGYGIYILSDNTTAGSAKAINLGTINMNGENNVGIYASGTTATVENKGSINILGEAKNDTCTGEDCQNVAIRLENGAQLVNSGEITSSAKIDLATVGGDVILEKGGKFAAEEISGDLKISASTVANTFTNETILADSIKAADVDNLNLDSQSYLYKAKIAANSNENAYDVVMERKDFKEITNDNNVAAYLEKNYENEKNMELFNALKSARTANEAERTNAKVMGTAMLPNIAEEELKVQRSLDRNIINELFRPAEDERKIVGADAMNVGRGNSGTLTGYDINSQSMYAVYDKKLDNNHRWGLGMSMTHTNTDYNDDSSRKNMAFQGYMPFTYSNGKGFSAVSMARIGYADGDYTRRGQDKSYKADTSAWNYGIINEARYTVSTKYANLTPFIGLNAIGWYQKAINEGKDALALHLDAENIFSLESALGLYLDKEIEFNEDNRLNVALGIGYYHEFADPYRGFDAHHGDGVLGNYKLRNKIHSRDRGILSAKVNYDYKNFSIYGELMQYLEEEHPLEVEGGVRYRF